MNKSITCCDKPENMVVYSDGVGNKYEQCKVCGKILKPIKSG